MKLPEPVAWMAEDTGSVASDHEKKMGYVLSDAFSVSLYTEAQLNQAIRDALEEAAQKCDNKAKETFSSQCQTWGDYFANAIRALKEQYK